MILACGSGASFSPVSGTRKRADRERTITPWRLAGSPAKASTLIAVSGRGEKSDEDGVLRGGRDWANL